MSFFQNPFEQDFIGALMYGDGERNASMSFKVPAAKNTSEAAVSGSYANYDFSSQNTLTFNFAIDKSNFRNYVAFTVNVAGATAAATTAQEVVAALNANSTFAEYFTASMTTDAKNHNRVLIKTRQRDRLSIRWYISNTSAETKLNFNRYAGVRDIPKFFQRHTIANRFTYEDSQSMLIRLTHDISANTVANPTVVTSTAHGLTTGDVIYIVNSNSTPVIDGQQTVTVSGANTFTVPVNVTVAGTRGEFLTATEYAIVQNAGLDYSAMKEDYEHMSGANGAFVFYKNTVDSSSRITQQIIYNAGATAGGFAKKVLQTFTGAQTQPDTRIELPYILTASDLITP